MRSASCLRFSFLRASTGKLGSLRHDWAHRNPLPHCSAFVTSWPLSLPWVKHSTILSGERWRERISEGGVHDPWNTRSETVTDSLAVNTAFLTSSVKRHANYHAADLVFSFPDTGAPAAPRRDCNGELSWPCCSRGEPLAKAYQCDGTWGSYHSSTIVIDQGALGAPEPWTRTLTQNTVRHELD